MSIRVMTWLWENSPASGTDLLVLLAIADNADDEGGNAWPSVATLAKKCRVSERSVQRALRSLERDHLLEIKENAGRSGTHRFRVDMTLGRQPVTPDVLSPRLFDGGDTGVTGGVTPMSPEPSLNRPSSPLPPASGGRCNPTSPIHVGCRACGTSPRELNKAAKEQRLPWCGACDEKTRLTGEDKPMRCPTCHPSLILEGTPA